MEIKLLQNMMARIQESLFRYMERLKISLPTRQCMFVLVMTCSILVPGQWSQAQTISVKPCQPYWTAGTCGPEPYATLKCAVDAAEQGDTIKLKCGNYMENLPIKKRLTLTSSGGTARIGMQRDHLWAGVNSGDIFDVPDEPLGMVSADKTLGAMLDILAASNMRVIRILIDYRLDLDKYGHALRKGVYNDCILKQIDYLMAEMKKRGLVLLIAFESHNWMTDYLIYKSIKNEDTQETWYSWRQCKTPENLYRHVSEYPDYPGSLTFEEDQLCRSKPGDDLLIEIYCKSPHRQRIEAGEFGQNYLIEDDDKYYFSNEKTKEFFKLRVAHILNHHNPYLGNRKWKDINDVIWAWGVHSEPEVISYEGLVPWINEMAAYIKGIDPDTYLALGTKAEDGDFLDEHFVDIDIYTIHAYSKHTPKGLKDLIRKFKSPQGIGGKHGKLLIVEECGFRVDIFKTCDEMHVPWMIWEFDWDLRRWSKWPERHPLDWHVMTTHAKRLWNTPNCSCSSASKPWRVGKIVDVRSPK